jgi:hypothetical protein
VTDDLNVTGSEREIFLRSLREYSEACQPPALTPGCPYAIDVSDGVRGCGEECMVLLAEHGAPAPIEEIAVGEFRIIRNRRPRSRRGPDNSSKPFDARELALQDEDKPHSERRTAALLFELKLRLCEPPDADESAAERRRRQIDGCYAELTKRGFDAELLVRHGVSRALASAIVLSVLVPRILAATEDPPEGLDALTPAPPGWDDVIQLGDSAPSRQFVNAVARHLQAASAGEHFLLAWIEEAPLDDIIDWHPPGLHLEGVQPDLGELCFLHRWVLDHFLNTYLGDWDTRSLHFEWEYIHGRLVPPCPASELSARRIAVEHIAPLIADRAIADAKPKTSTPLNRYVMLAVDLLHEGRRNAAAALFEVVMQFEPANAEAHNNYAFCVLLDRPDVALSELDKAVEAGWAQNPIVIANRMFAMMLLGRYTSALSLAETVVDNFDMFPPFNGWMWTFEGESKLFEVPDIRGYALDLAVEIASRAGNPELVLQWRTNRDRLLA